MPPWTLCAISVADICSHVYWVDIPKRRIVGLYHNFIFICWRNCILFKVVVPFYNPTNNVWGFLFLQILTDIYLLSSYDSSSRCEMVTHWGFNLCFLSDDTEHLFMYWIAICVSWAKCLFFRSFVGLVEFIRIFFYKFWIQVPYCKYFFMSVVWHVLSVLNFCEVLLIDYFLLWMMLLMLHLRNLCFGFQEFLHIF